MKRNVWTLAGLATAAVAGIVVFGLLAQACGNKPVPGAAARLEQFEADPVVKFRAPGTKLIDHSKESGEELWNMEQTETRLDQVFSMTGDAAETVEAYRSVAGAAGWGLVFEGCSRSEQATGLAYRRNVDGQSAVLRIRAELGSSPESTRHKDTLTVAIVAGGLSDVVDVGIRRNDLRCLTGLDPASPELAVPKVDHVTPEALCAAVNLDGISGVKEVSPLEDPGKGYPSQCAFDGGEHVGYLFEVSEATEPLAYYQDRSPSDAAPGEPFFFVDYEEGIWVQSTHGPLVVHIRSRSPEYGLSPERLMRIANDLATL